MIHRPLAPLRSSFVLFLAVILTLVGFYIEPSHAGQVRLSGGMAQTVMTIGKTRTAYLHIDLSGIALASVRDRSPVNVALVIDRSGSMTGAKLAQAKRAAIMALGLLDRRDIVSIVTYDSRVDVLVPATPLRDRQLIQQKIENIFAGGSTALYDGVKKGGEQLETFLNRERVNRLILLSDGLANVGPKSPDAIARLGYRLIDKGISVTTLGLGTGYNEDLMTKLANVTDGNHAFVENPDELEKFFALEFGDLTSVVGQDVIIEIHLHAGIHAKRTLWRKSEIRGNTVTARINQVYGGQQKDLTLEVEVPTDRPVGAYDIADVTVRYKDMAEKREVVLRDTIRLTLSKSHKEAAASIDKSVMSRVVALEAIEKNKAAMKLRDQGRIDAARKAYESNAAYLKDQAAVLSAPALAKQAAQADDYAKNLDRSNWLKTRKKQMHEQRSTGAISKY